MQKLLATFLLTLLSSGALFSQQDTANIIKVNGRYGIIDRGTNQGITNSQYLEVKRLQAGRLEVVGKVRVIRTTANRAAVELVEGQGLQLRREDRLFVIPPVVRRAGNEAFADEVSTVHQSASEMLKKQNQARRKDIQPISGNTPEVPASEPPESPSVYPRHANPGLKKPWVGFNTGFIVPSGSLSSVYATSFIIGASYMVETSPDVRLGLELNNSFVSSSSFDSGSFLDLTTESSSLFEAFVVLQKYFGRYFFIETGGGIVRPKITTMNVDGVKSSFSSTHLGLLGGTGVFIPTSPYAGLTVKGRWHNYFDHSTKHYFGLTGGFRFKIK